MKKILLFFVLISYLFLNFNLVGADYLGDSISRFKNSVSANELNSIEDKKQYFCEKTFLIAFMRRPFTENENLICSDIFEQKIEDQMNFMSFVLGNRGIY
ncbi:MAG: hypothetical protein PHH98_01995 [Candidatus Gracilibacteria bacterium]|nr:hypothetical protein [Candidatus Gracilibacteria bacterium]